jgi:FSR family fosmidomycin resistance protein-like MFS transporter
LVPAVIFVSLSGMILASAFPAMVVYAQDLMPQSTGMVAGLMFGLAFGTAALGAAGLGVLADQIGIVGVYQVCAFLPLLGLVALFLPEPRT